MSNEITQYLVQPRQIQTLKESGMTEKDRREFVQRVQSLVLNNPNINELQPMSVFNVALLMNSLKLSPELQTAYMVPYNSKNGKVAQFQMGYKGYVELAMRTNMYSKIDCVAVKESDLVSYDIDTNTYTWRDTQLTTFREIEDRMNETTIGYRAFAITHTGDKQEMFMSMREIEAHHTKFSQAYKYKDKFGNIFNTNKDAMDRKVVLKLFINRQLIKSMNVDDSRDIRKAITNDSAVLQGKKGETISYIDNPQSKGEDKKIMTNEPIVKERKGRTSFDYSNVEMEEVVFDDKVENRQTMNEIKKESVDNQSATPFSDIVKD